VPSRPTKRSSETHRCWRALDSPFVVARFWVYASSLRYAELTPVTPGWIVIRQIGVVILDRYPLRDAHPEVPGSPSLP
jgi:hypothetical protein